MRKRRWWLLLAVGFVVWHVVFDLQVEDAATRYVAQQELAAQGIGQPVPIDEVMRPALALSARVASAWSVLAVTVAYVLTCSARRAHSGPARTS